MVTFLKNILTLACLGGVFYFGYLNRNKILAYIRGKTPDLLPSGCNTNEISFPKSSFIANASLFTGSYEPLYSAVHNPDTSLEDKECILQDWELRFLATQEKDSFANWLKKPSNNCINNKLEDLLNEIFSCGIIRDHKETFIIDEQSIKEYIEWSGSVLQCGDKVKSCSPSWSLNGICIEKGIVTKI